MSRYRLLDACDKINDYMYMGGFRCAEPNVYKPLGIKYIIDATNVKRNKVPPDITSYFHIAVEDSEHANLEIHFDKATTTMKEARDRGDKILVHCAAGISRSSTLVIAFLMRYENMPLKDAYLFVKSKRSVISPNSGFWRQLVSYERKLFNGNNSVNMIQMRYREMPDIICEELNLTPRLNFASTN